MKWYISAFFVFTIRAMELPSQKTNIYSESLVIKDSGASFLLDRKNNTVVYQPKNGSSIKKTYIAQIISLQHHHKILPGLHKMLCPQADACWVEFENHFEFLYFDERLR